MKTQTKNGKYALKGVKFAGKTVLGADEVTNRKIVRMAKDARARGFIAQNGSVSANVKFTVPELALTNMNYILHNESINKCASPIEAILTTLGATENIVNEVLGIADVPVGYKLSQLETSKLLLWATIYTRKCKEIKDKKVREFRSYLTRTSCFI